MIINHKWIQLSNKESRRGDTSLCPVFRIFKQKKHNFGFVTQQVKSFTPTQRQNASIAIL